MSYSDYIDPQQVVIKVEKIEKKNPIILALL